MAEDFGDTSAKCLSLVDPEVVQVRSTARRDHAFNLAGCAAGDAAMTLRYPLLPELSPEAQAAQTALAQRRAAIEARWLLGGAERLHQVAARAAKRPERPLARVVSIKTRQPISELDAALVKWGAAIAAADRRKAQKEGDG